MTVICALHVVPGETWIGSDTMAAYGDVPMDVGGKWVVGNRWAIGVSGCYRAINLIRAKVMPTLDVGADAFHVAESIRRALKDDDWTPQPGRYVPDYGQGMIIASADGVFQVSWDFAVLSADTRFVADGSGGDLALGCDWGSFDCTPADRLFSAIGAATALDINCGGDPWVQRLLPVTDEGKENAKVG